MKRALNKLMALLGYVPVAELRRAEDTVAKTARLYQSLRADHTHLLSRIALGQDSRRGPIRYERDIFGGRDTVSADYALPKPAFSL